MYELDYDLRAAIDSNQSPSSPVEEVLASISGVNDEAPWHWLVRLEDGRFAYICGSCDYTGWDCQSSIDIHEADTLQEAIRLIGEAERPELEGQLANRN